MHQCCKYEVSTFIYSGLSQSSDCFPLTTHLPFNNGISSNLTIYQGLKVFPLLF